MTDSPLAELQPVVERVRLHAELALLVMLDHGFGHADPRLPAETYLHNDDARGRVFRLGLKPQGAYTEVAERTADAIAKLAVPSTPLLDSLCRRLGLERAERGVLTVALAHELDRDVRSLCAALSGRRPAGLYADHCLQLAAGEVDGDADLARALSPNSRLHDLVLARDAGGLLELTVLARQWLTGDTQLPARLRPWVDIITEDPRPSLEADAAAHLAKLAERLDPVGGAKAPVVVQAPQGAGKGRVAAALAASLGMPLLCTSFARLEQGGALGHLDELLRFARVHGLGVYLAGLETMHDRQQRSLAIATLVHAGLELAILGTRRPGLIRLDQHPFHYCGLQKPDLASRERAWRNALAEIEAKADDERAALYARRFVVGPSDIVEACREAKSFASLAGRPVGEQDVEAALARQLSLDLGSFATRVGRRALWNEMVLNEEVSEPLRDMIAMVQQRSQILEEWGYARHLGLSRGVSALFSGSPGTGKTMAASVISGELGLELFRIDLSQVVSKWVGETEKHLAKIFDEAQNANAMLLFDEADSIFGKRTEFKSASDRYANLEVNYILQRMEQFDGVSILTTNLETAIDQAFTRRLNFRIRFPDPDPDERLKLWTALVPPETGLRDLPDLQRLANRFEMTGGHIRNAIVRAAVIAAREGRAMRADDLEAGALSEYAELGKVMGAF